MANRADETSGANEANGTSATHGTRGTPAVREASARAGIGSHALRLRFGDFLLDMRRAELSRAGQPVALRPKALALLSLLAARAGEAVAKEELQAALWPGVIVTDDSLTQCVAELRAALGDRGGQAIIRTLPRLGYRFDAPVQMLAEAQTPEGAGAAAGDEAPAATVPAHAHTPATQAPTAPSQAHAATRGDAALPPRAPGPETGQWRSPPAPRRRRAWPLAVSSLTVGVLLLAVLGVVGVGVGVGVGRFRSPPIDTAIAAARSLAVLPFVDLSVPPAPHVAEAVLDAIVADLGHAPDARVIVAGPAQATADPRRVGLELGARQVLTGAVRSDGGRIEVTVRAVDSIRGALLWSARFESGHADWEWVRDVSRRVAGSLEIRLEQMTAEPARHQARSDEAMEQWMRGDYLLRHVKNHDDLLQARRHLEAALAIDSRSVHALSTLAMTHYREVNFRWSPNRKQSLAVAKDLAQRALAIEPNHPLALGALGNAYAFDNDFDAAMPVVEKELRLNPNSAHAHRNAASLLYFLGRLDQKLEAHAQTALRLGPLDPLNVGISHSILGFLRLDQSRDEESYAEFQRARLAAPVLWGPRFGLVAAAALSGRIEEARSLLDDASKARPGVTLALLNGVRNSNHPDFVAHHQRYYEGLRLAGMREGTPQAAPVAAAAPANEAPR